MLQHTLAVCLVLGSAASAQQQQHYAYPPGVFLWVPAPFLARHHPALVPPSSAPLAKAAVPESPAPDVITQGLHLGSGGGAEGYDGYGNDAPASVITHGPQPGAYTAVSSDEPSEATQFHSQDGFGQVIFGHSSPQQARLETRAVDGTVRGSYSYVNPEGRTIKIAYTAGENGFQPVEEAGEGGGVLPKQVTETPEVAAARALHARLYDQARWLAEASPEYPIPKPEVPSVVEQPVIPPEHTVEHAVEHDQTAGSAVGPDYQPDSLYTNLGTVGVESDEELEYYGAAKGKPLPYAAVNRDSPLNFYGFRTSGSPLAYSGAYQFPGGNHPYFRTAPEVLGPLLSPYSAPSLYEQQHLHRVAPMHHELPRGAEVRKAVTPSKKPANLEYFGAAKLQAYSAANLLYNDMESRRGRSMPEPAVPEARFSSYQQTAPVFVGVGVAPQADPVDDQPSLRTALGSSSANKPVEEKPADSPAQAPASVSLKAAFFGAVPVAAVHDAQVAPGQTVKDHQKLPVYMEAN